MTSRSVFILFSLTLGLARVDGGCKGPVPPASAIVDDIKVDVNAACTTIIAVTQEAVVQLVCVTAEDVAALADIIAHQVSPNVAGPSKCVTAQGQTVCATPGQMLAAIRTINARRDGGK